MLETLNLKPQGHQPVRFPKTGEYVALHFRTEKITDRGEKKDRLVRAIAVGKHPWGARGGASGGKLVDGEYVLGMDNHNTDNFGPLLLDLLTAAVHQNPEGSDVLRSAGEMAMTLKDQTTCGKTQILCPRCSRPKGLTLAGNFCRQASAAWFVNGTKTYPMKFASSVCLQCLESLRDATQEDMNATINPSGEKAIAKGIVEILEKWASLGPRYFLARDAYTPILNAIDALISEIKN